MKKLTLASIIASLLATSAFAAQQQSDAPQMPKLTDKTFVALDSDEDGFISQQEAKQDNIWNVFVKVDEDADGQINPREFNTYASIYSEADIDLADTVDSNAENALDEVETGSDEAISAADSELSRAKQNAISAKAQNSNAELSTQLTEHDSHDDVNAMTDSEDQMKDAESNVQNALDNAKELSLQGQDAIDDNIDQSTDALNQQLDDSKSEIATSSTTTINADLENENPALKIPEQPEPIEQAFADVDADEDGFITKVEASDAAIAEHFDNADVNSDDKISQQEYDTFVKGQHLIERD
ncbi:EF-hand domain-containing protein [uncultured Paraglaciecola sp.]|uniref:EF-hand domain-containing protein n=1 Tax=uncultured Paraglaciecola sp. TaxID=1765024 RepID=UPI0030DB47C4|tara:strand:- start:4383 stop:5279 length:897 start_codon:yes stop_codon:yes gene_type:complete